MYIYVILQSIAAANGPGEAGFDRKAASAGANRDIANGQRREREKARRQESKTGACGNWPVAFILNQRHARHGCCLWPCAGV